MSNTQDPRSSGGSLSAATLNTTSMRHASSVLGFALVALSLSAPLSAADKASRAAGEATYHSAGCERCHGADWSGTDRGPDLRGIGKRSKRDEIDKQIRAGGGGMPAFGDVLTDPQIVQLVDFLEAQKKTPKRSKQPVPAPQPEKPKPADPE